MNERPLARAAARLLRREKPRIMPPSENARARGIEAVRAALRAEKRRRMRMRVGIAAFAAAVAAVVIFGVVRRRPTQALPPPAPSVVAYVDGTGASVVSGGHIVANGGTSTIRLSTGTRLTLDAPGELNVVEQGASQIYSLENGALRADVAKLAPGQRFVVRTVDAEIEVHGTSFRVTLVKEDACAPGVRTRVQVLEGVVTVRAKGLDDRLFAGDAWPRACAIAAPLPSTSATVAAPVPTIALPKAKPATLAPATSPSVLAEQNDAFASAVEAKKSGNVSLAIDRFGAFERKYPSSALAETAAVERMRLLAATDPPRAKEAAQSYLLRYPTGTARVQAQKLVDGL
ncbi:MAG: FecR domain-containing protein [Polyangiales bacterium]